MFYLFSNEYISWDKSILNNRNYPNKLDIYLQIIMTLNTNSILEKFIRIKL